MRQCKLYFIIIILLKPAISLSGAMTFQSVVQPPMVMANKSFTVVLETTIRTRGRGWGYEGWENTLPYLGIRLPRGWTIPNDRITCTGEYEASIRYDVGLSLDQEAVSPPPAGYVWWVGRGDVEAEGEGPVTIDIHIQTDDQVGLFSLDYMSGNARDGLDQQRSNGHEIEVVVDARSPGGLQATVEGESVHLSWGVPHNIEGLVGYVIYRDETVISSSFVAETSYVEPAPSGGLHRYKVAAFYSDGEVYFTAPVECYVFLRAGGSGTAQDPYLIATARQLMALDQHPRLMDQHFQLISDIDLDPNLPGRRIFARAVISPDISEVREGFQGTPFIGVFDGNHHTVRNLTVEGHSFLGLFGAVGPEARIVNLDVNNADVTGYGQNIGSIVAYNGGTVQHCRSSGLVIGHRDVGGLIGCNDQGQIIDSHSTANVVGIQYVGGVLGSQLAGRSGGATVLNSFATGDVFGWHWIGGLIGFNQGTVSRCYSRGFTNGSSFVGGLVGYNAGTGFLTDAYCLGPVQGEDRVGGLAGFNAGSIRFTYSTGEVIGVSHVGGLVGKSDAQAEVIASFWDMEVSGQPSSSGGMGLTTAELQQVNTYVDAGWDFAGESENGTENIWYLAKEGYAQFFSFEGVGTSEDPYLVDTVWHLASIGSDPDMLDKHFKLTQHIDLDPNQLGSRVFTRAVIAPDVNSTSKYYEGIPFSGVFDGCGYEIRNLNIVGSGHLGLFGSLASNGDVSNLCVVMAHIEGSELDSQGILVGKNEGHVTSCYSSGFISGSGYGTGGLIGSNFGEVRYCTNAADVNGYRYVGGLVGGNYAGQVSDCYSTGVVSSTGSWVGGLVGHNKAFVVKSYCTGAVAGEASYVGGLLGRNHPGGCVDKCYSTGSVVGNRQVGGLVGRNEHGSISECYSIGLVTGNEHVGGLLGWNDWSVTNSFWNIETSGQSDSAGGFGTNTAQMQDMDTYLNAGWDFFAVEFDGDEDVWVMDAYPVHFTSQIPGHGTREAPYLISKGNKFIVLRNVVHSAHYRLTEDIDVGAIQWSDSVVPYFSGSFDGGGFAIMNLTIVGEDDLGFFGVIGPGATVSDLAIVNADVTGTGDNIGILAGTNNGSVSHCSSIGAVHGHGFSLGGLIGENTGSIETCYSISSVSGDDAFGVGGLVGMNGGLIEACYSGGSIAGRCEASGGFVGSNNKGGRVLNCYSTCTSTASEGGFVGVAKGDAAYCYSVGASAGRGFAGGHKATGDVIHCFWDIETSGQTRSSAGTGLTTTEMQTAATFLEAGWDFVDETENGTDDIWWILEGQDYPRLWWELIPEN